MTDNRVHPNQDAKSDSGDDKQTTQANITNQLLNESLIPEKASLPDQLQPESAEQLETTDPTQFKIQTELENETEEEHQKNILEEKLEQDDKPPIEVVRELNNAGESFKFPFILS